MKIRDTSATERAAFRRCRRQWLLGTVHRLDPQEGNVHTFLGTIYHYALQAYYEAVKAGHDPVDARDAALDAFQSAYDVEVDVIRAQLGFLAVQGLPPFKEMAKLGMEMLQNYLDREETDPLLDEVVAVETRVNVAIKRPGGKQRVGTLSVQADVVGIKDGELSVADHKTASRAVRSAHLDLDDQLTAEVYAWWQHSGDWPERAIYNVSYKKHAGAPKQLKSGKLSKAKDQGTTHALYLQEIHRLGLEPADYVDILLFLVERERRGEDPLFRRETVFRTPGQMDAFARDLYHEYRDMKDVAAHPERAYPNPTADNCARCDVRSVCTTIQDDGDVSAVITNDFVVAEPRR